MSDGSNGELPYLICELANSHGGSGALLEQLVDAFASLDYPKKGIKFQVFKADGLALPDFPWYSVYQELERPADSWRALIARAAEHGEVWIDVFDTYSVDVIRENFDRVAGIKLQASVLENHEVFSQLAALELAGKRIVINISGFGLDEIAGYVKSFRSLTDHLVLQIGFQSYPTSIADTGLQKIPVLKAAFPGLALGMADHADANTDFALLAPVYAATLGCAYVEKHLCIDRKSAKYDGFSALEKPQMDRLCEMLKENAQARSGRFVSASEKSYLDKSVQIPVARAVLATQSLVGLPDLLFRRTAEQGLSWPQLAQLQRGRMVLAHDAQVHKPLSAQDFRPARVAAIVACRMKSSRLPRKALLPMGGMPSVERCLYQCLSFPGVDQVILATSSLPEDDALEQSWAEGKTGIWRGDPEDVISRYLGAAERFGADVIVRVTADCPLVLPEIVQHLMDEHFATGADYTAARECAVGSAPEIINVAAFRRVLAHFGRADYSEYMTWYFRNNPDHFKVYLVDLPPALVRGYRMTLDYPEDLEMFEALYRELGTQARAHTGKEVFAALDRREDIGRINSTFTPKYVADKELVALLNKVTRMTPA
jgi:N,N'-diacetyllegionaminate synthase